MATLIFAGPAYADRCAELGASFHAQLEAFVPDNHPDDLDHNLMVGQTLLLTVDYESPLIAERLYNQWAAGTGYGTCLWLGTMQSSRDSWRGQVFDIGTRVIVLDSAYRVKPFEECVLCHS